MALDNYYTKCRKCGKDEYRETSIYDGWEGVLHCPKCNHSVVRYEELKDKGKKNK